MAHGFPDWSPIATGASSELPTYTTLPTYTPPAGVSANTAFTLFNPAASTTLVKVRELGVYVLLPALTDGFNYGILYFGEVLTSGGGVVTGPNAVDPSSPPAIAELRAPPNANVVQNAILAAVPFSIERRRALQPARFDQGVIKIPLYQHAAAGQLQPLTFHPGQGLSLIVTSQNAYGTFYPYTQHTEEPGT